MSGKKKYSDELKLQIVMEYLEGKNGGFKTLAAKYGRASANIAVADKSILVIVTSNGPNRIG